jgi:uncharacterized protein YqhQ
MSRGIDVRKPVLVGGQAVLEGVMMRGPGAVATAVRRPDGGIEVRRERFVSLTETSRLCRLPLVRGAVALFEMLILGIRTLNFSAEIALRSSSPATGGNGENGDEKARARGTSRMSVSLFVTIAFSLVSGIAIFFVTPLLVATWFFQVEQDPYRFNLVAGTIRMLLFLGYLGGISVLKDIRRLFAYHGAEHKAVFAFERGVPLTVQSAAEQSRFHPRCGTSFVLLVMLVAIALFSVLDSFLVMGFGTITLLTRLETHLPLIPLIGGASYELIKLSAKHSQTPLGKAIAAPGLWLQRITTKEPDEQQLGVALVALRSALGVEGGQEPLGHPRAVEEISHH